MGVWSEGEIQEVFPLFFDEEGGETISFGAGDVSDGGEGVGCVAGAVGGGSVDENGFDVVLRSGGFAMRGESRVVLLECAVVLPGGAGDGGAVLEIEQSDEESSSDRSFRRPGLALRHCGDGDGLGELSR